MEQITKGIGGLIIVRDAAESALALPRKYGVGDVPVVLTDRSFTAARQFKTVPYGDSMLVNGTLRPKFGIPAQVVRLRLLNAAIERSYNLGFSDGRTFYLIATDGGLLDAPVPLTRLLLSAGERVEILVNCTGAWVVKYSGAIDDNGEDPKNAKPLLGNALDDLLAEKPVREPQTESFGCKIFYRK